jgi:hypothetical protein
MSGGSGAGGAGAGGMAGSGAGTGGMPGGMCAMDDFEIEHTAQSAGTAHTHLPLMNVGMVIGQINAGMAFTITVPGMHTHDLMISAAEAMMLRDGGTVTGKISSSDGAPAHTHTYTLSCMG